MMKNVFKLLLFILFNCAIFCQVACAGWGALTIDSEGSVGILCMVSNCILYAGIKGSTGWTIFRKIRSVRPRVLSLSYYWQGDLSGILYNPALLGNVKGKELGLTTGFGLADERLSGVFYAAPFRGRNSIGCGIFNYDYGKAELSWVEADQFFSRTVSAQSDYMGIFSIGQKINNHVKGGISIKAAKSRIAEEASAYAFAFDTGLNCNLGRKLCFSLAAQNIGMSTKFIEKTEKLPSSVMGGISYFTNAGLGYLLTALEIPYLISESRFTPSLGAELGIWPISIFGGYRLYAEEARFNYGFGITMKNYDFCYSYTPAKWLDSTHRFSASMKLDKLPDIRNKIRLDYKKKAPERKEKRLQKHLDNSNRVNKDIIYKDSNTLLKDSYIKLEKHNTRIGIGIGIPYGVVGGNFEVNTGDYLSWLFGLGYSPGGAAYSIGGRLYAAPRKNKLRPCVTALYGVVAVLEKKIYSSYYYYYYYYSSSSRTEYDNLNGTALGVGFKYNKLRSSWDFDVLYLNYDLPAKATIQGGNIKISIGYGWHF